MPDVESLNIGGFMYYTRQPDHPSPGIMLSNIATKKKKGNSNNNIYNKIITLCSTSNICLFLSHYRG